MKTVNTNLACFSAFSDRLVRMEFDPRGQLEESLGGCVANRPAAVPFASRTELEIRYCDDGKNFHEGNLRVTPPESGKVIWTPGQVDKQNLGYGRGPARNNRGRTSSGYGCVSRQ